MRRGEERRGEETRVQSRAEQSRAEQSRAEQSRAEQSRTDTVILFSISTGTNETTTNRHTDLEVAVELVVGAVLARVRRDHHEDGEAVDENDGDDVVEGAEVVSLPAATRDRLHDRGQQ